LPRDLDDQVPRAHEAARRTEDLGDDLLGVAAPSPAAASPAAQRRDLRRFGDQAVGLHGVADDRVLHRGCQPGKPRRLGLGGLLRRGLDGGRYQQTADRSDHGQPDDRKQDDAAAVQAAVAWLVVEDVHAYSLSCREPADAGCSSPGPRYGGMSSGDGVGSSASEVS
jgi:hypothetical protein